jgi:hypothetical protein
MGIKNFKRLLNSIPNCTELNSESKPKLILVFGLGLGVTQDPDPGLGVIQDQYIVFLAECMLFY